MSPGKRLLLVCAVCMAVGVALLPTRGVWAPDEARYAQVAREMKRAGHWLVPLLNGDLYSQKPPLFFDLTVLTSLGQEDVPEWAVKVPSLLAALAALLALGAIGARTIGPEGTWLAPLLLGTMFKFSWQAQFGQIDMLVTGLVVIQVALGLRLSSGEGSRVAGVLGMVALGTAGILAKGPVACLLPWIILLAYLAAGRNFAGLKRLGLPWIALGTVALSALWLGAAAWLQSGDYVRGLVLRQSVQRYLEPWHHKAPAYYYLGIFFSDGLPYSLLVVPFIWVIARSKRWREPAVLLSLTWILTYLVFFSASSGKRSVYILPLFPAMALLVAFGLRAISREEWPRRGLAGAWLVLTVILALGLIAAVLILPPAYSSLRPWIISGLAVLTIAGLGAWRLTLSGRAIASAVAVAAGAVLFMFTTAVPVSIILDPTKSPRELGARIRSEVPPGGSVGVFPNLVPSVNYYADSTTTVFPEKASADALRFLLERPGRILLVQESDWSLGIPRGARFLGAYTLGEDRFLLLGGPPGASGNGSTD